MQTYQEVQKSVHRGKPRVWLEGKLPARAGFTPGIKYKRVHEQGGLVLRIDETGDKVVCSKEVRGRVIPVIDINSNKALDIFEGHTELRIVMRENEIIILPTIVNKMVKERNNRLLHKLKNNLPLDVGALAYGAGVLDHAIHEGIEEGGLTANLAFANEIREDLTVHAMRVNRTFTDKTVALVAPMQHIAYDPAALARLPQVDVLTAGIPCSGASSSGRAKLGLALPEDHPLVGHLIASAIAIIVRANPSMVVIENVPNYANSASASILRQQLRDCGYVIHERELLATEWGDLEKRRRWCFVAVSRDIAFDLQAMMPEPFEVRQLKSIMEPDEAVEDRWSMMPGLKAKLERDRAAGKGFEMQLYTGDENSINTLTKGISKNRSTDPKWINRNNPELLRIPTANEHADCKGVPKELIDGLSQTTAHEMLGQGICYRPFKALGKHLAKSLIAHGQRDAANDVAMEDAPARKVAG